MIGVPEHHLKNGLLFWKPTSDGREIGVYPQLWGAGLLFRGPLEFDGGYDESWHFLRLEDAIDTFNRWDGEGAGPLDLGYALRRSQHGG